MAHEVELGDAMRVGVDHVQGACLHRHPDQRVREIEALGVGVDLEQHPMVARGGDDLREIDRRRLALSDQAAGRMRQRVDPRMGDRGEDTLRHRLLAHPELRVDGGEDVVELLQRLVVEIELAVLEDVDLGPVKDRDLGQLAAEGLDRAMLPFQRRPIEPARNAQRLRVVRDRDVLVATRDARLDHLAERVLAVGRVRVHVEVSADLTELDELRQLPVASGLHLAAVFAQLRRDERKPHGVEDLLLGTTADATFAPEDAVLVDLELPPDTEQSDRDVVRLRSREVVERCSPADRIDHPHVDLHARAKHGGALRPAVRKHRRDLGVGAEALRDLVRVVRCDEQIEIADRLAPPAQAPGDADLLDAPRAPHVLDERRRMGVRFGEADAPHMRVLLGAALEDPLLERLADAADVVELAVLRCGLELLDGAEVELVVEELRTLRADAGDAHHHREAPGDLLEQLAVEIEVTGRRELADLPGQILADASELAELQRVALDDLRRGLGQRLDRSRSGPIRTDAELVLAEDLEQVGDLIEHACDVCVVHDCSPHR